MNITTQNNIQELQLIQSAIDTIKGICATISNDERTVGLKLSLDINANSLEYIGLQIQAGALSHPQALMACVIALGHIGVQMDTYIMEQLEDLGYTNEATLIETQWEYILNIIKVDEHC